MEMSAFKTTKLSKHKSFVIYALNTVICRNINFLKVVNKLQLKASCVLTALFI